MRNSTTTLFHESCLLTLICELVEPSESVYLIVANIRDGCIDEARRLGAYCGDHLRFVAISKRLAAARRAGGHEEGVGGSTTTRRGGEGG